MNKTNNIMTIKGQPAAVSFESEMGAFREEEQERLTVRISSRLGSRLTAAAKQHSISKNQPIVDVLEREFAVSS